MCDRAVSLCKFCLCMYVYIYKYSPIYIHNTEEYLKHFYLIVLFFFVTHITYHYLKKVCICDTHTHTHPQEHGIGLLIIYGF